MPRNGTGIANTTGMKIAVPVWSERISPVFDVAGRLLIVELEEGVEVARNEYPLPPTDAVRKVRQLGEMGVEVLICGAVSQPILAMLAGSGIRVIPQTCGLVEDVLRAYMTGRLDRPMFLMPGCRRGRMRFQGRRRRGRPFQP